VQRRINVTRTTHVFEEESEEQTGGDPKFIISRGGANREMFFLVRKMYEYLKGTPETWTRLLPRPASVVQETHRVLENSVVRKVQDAIEQYTHSERHYKDATLGTTITYWLCGLLGVENDRVEEAYAHLGIKKHHTKEGRWLLYKRRNELLMLPIKLDEDQAQGIDKEEANGANDGS
jgi:hypothetical protein